MGLLILLYKRLVQVKASNKLSREDLLVYLRNLRDDYLEKIQVGETGEDTLKEVV